MALPRDPTRAGAPATPPLPPQREGVDLTTLFLSAVASAAAAYVTSKIWAPGTLFSAAMSPVIVALVKEGLRKPTEVVAAVVPAAVTRSGRTRGGGVQPVTAAREDELPDDLGEHLEGGAPPPYPPPAPGAEAGPVRVYSTRGRRLRWRLAVVTGLLGFAVCVVLYTVPELITGQSVGDPNSATTFFSGSHRRSAPTKQPTQTTTSTTRTAPTTTATTPGATTTEPTPTVTTTVTTPAAPPQTTTTPAVPGPGQTTPTDTTGTPPPAGTPPTATTP